jgi:hypothetical protein
MSVGKTNQVFPSPSEILTMHRQAENSGRWSLALCEGYPESSLSVFGTNGSRFSVLVMRKDILPREYTGERGGWTLSDGWHAGRTVRFSLRWAVDSERSGFVILCGRETAIPFTAPA